jgi:hypothetical protein
MGAESGAELQFPIKLRIEDGDGVRLIEYGGERPLTIGRSEAADICLTTERVSRQHAEIRREDGKLLIVDAGSTNGTWVGEQRVGRAELMPGSIIRIGKVRLTVEAAVPYPLAAPAPLPAASPAAEPPEPSASPAAAPPAAPGGPARRGRQRRLLARRSGLPALLAAAAIVAFVGLALHLLRTQAAGPGAPASSRANDDPLRDPGISKAPSELPPAGDPPPPWPPNGAAREVPFSFAAASRETYALEPLAPHPLLAAPALEELAAAEAMLEEASRRAIEGELGRAAIESFEAVAQTFPGTPAAEEARKRVTLLEAVRRGMDRERRESARKLLERLIEEGRPGAALAAARFLELEAEGDDATAFWRRTVEELEAAAERRFRELEEALSKHLEAGEAGEALRAVAAASAAFGGTDFYGALLGRHVEASLSPPYSTERTLESPVAVELRNRAALAFEDCRFEDLVPIYNSLLALDLPPEERLRTVEALVEAFYLAGLFREFLAFSAQFPVEVSMTEGYPGRVVRADPKEVEYELDIGERRAAYRDRLPWSRIPHAKKLKLFEAARLGRDGLLGLVYFALRTGYEEGAQDLLVRLRRRKDAAELADALLARHLGIPVPQGGFVEFEGRLVTPEERVATLSRRKQAEEEEKLARAEMRRLRREAGTGAYIELARRWRREGFFTHAQAMLEEVARRWPDSEPGREARRLLDDPVLAVKTLIESGPAENRIGIYFLGDGYPARDDYQAAFLVSAQRALAILLKQEPYREYVSYFNASAVQLASKDAGLDREPGGVERRTALDGKVEWDRFTVNASRLREVLRSLGSTRPGQQAVVIGNDYAGVATGGGGISCVAKTMLDALGHEIGHALAGLRDEYDFEAGNDPKRRIEKKREPNVPVSELPPNLMAGSNRDEVLAKALWRYWIEAGEERWWNGSKVELFQGGNYTPFNVWRPQAACKMRSSWSNFCVVCMEQMVKSIYKHVRPIDRAEPGEREIQLSGLRELEVKVWPMKPATHLLEATWELIRLPDGEPSGPTIVVQQPKPEVFRTFYRRFEPDGRVVEVALLRPRDLQGRRYLLRVNVRDPTPWVLKDDEGLLRQSREWVITTAGGRP